MMEAPTSLAPRRSKRRAAEAISPIKPSRTSAAEPLVTTPSKRRSKRVRFSTGSTLNNLNVNNLPAGTTGLTPAISKQSIATPRSRRRVSTPAPSRSVSMPVVLPPSSPAIDGEVQFTPLRQALDGRMQRRIKRNHMAEELEGYERDKREMRDLRREIDSKDAELKKLRSQVVEIGKHRLSPIQENPLGGKEVDDRIVDIEAELSLLRRSFQEFDDRASPVGEDDEGVFGGDEDWTDIPRSSSGGLQSESGDTIRIYEDEPSITQPSTTRLPSIADIQDATSMGLELESARQAKRSFLQSSFTRRSLDASDLHFADSPSKPTAHISSPMPKITTGVLTNLTKQLKAANARAEDAELALEALEGEVRALASGFTTTNTSAQESLNALADHFRHVRLELERLFPGEVTLGLDANHYRALLPELITKLKSVMKQLSNTNLEYANLRVQEKTLRTNFDSAANAHRSAQLKIDQLQSKTEDLEKTLDEYTQSLLDERIRASNAENAAKEHLTNNDKLKSALDTYRTDVSRLETLISTMEAEHQAALSEINTAHTSKVSDMQALVASEVTGRQKAESSAVARLRTIQDLEEKLSSARDRADDIEASLTQDIRGLNTRNSNLSTALAAAETEIARLRRLVAKCEKRYKEEVYRGEEAMREFRNDALAMANKMVGMSKGYRRKSKMGLANWELESDPVVMPSSDTNDGNNTMPMTPSSIVRFADYSEVRNLGPEDGETDIDEDEDEDEDEQPSSEPERDDSVHDNNDDEDEHIPGSVEVSRGKGGRRRSVTLTPQMTVSSMKMLHEQQHQLKQQKRKGRRKYDSGIGMAMSDDGDDGGSSEIGEEGDDSGLANFDVDIDADVDVEMEAMGTFAEPAF